MEYDRRDNFPFDFERKGTQFGLESKEKLSRQSYSIQFNIKWQSILY